MSRFQCEKYPPGWDVKYDLNTGKCYYINYITKAMTLEDPRIDQRIHYQPLQNERSSNECIALQTQPLHGSPYHVYPTNNYTPVQAFQAGPNIPSLHNMSASPLLANNRLEMSPLVRHSSSGSPFPTNRIISQLAKNNHLHQSNGSNIQETSFSNPAEVEMSVAKINAMFPTADEYHIRLLLKKYHNREAVVISALQVEKHPLTTPGPFSTPPPPGRHTLSGAASAIMAMTPTFGRISRNTDSPIPRPGSRASGCSYGSPNISEQYRSSPKPHSSPKMKLRYLKSIFPSAEETLLLDILANADNNVQKASERLKEMGYQKRDTTAPRLSNRQKEEQVKREQHERENTPPPKPKVLTNVEKGKIKQELQKRYKDVPSRIITMALESVDYSEDRASQILQIVMQENDESKNDKSVLIIDDKDNDANFKDDEKLGDQNEGEHSRHSAIKETDERKQETQELSPSIPSSTSSSLSATPYNQGDTVPACSSKSRRNRSKARSDHIKSSPVSVESRQSDFQSVITRIHVGGANPNLYTGPKESLLLADYITWNGPNPDLCVGIKSLAKGPDPTNRVGNNGSLAKGPNKDLCKGSTIAAQSSVYSQLTRPLSTNVKCN